MTIVELMLEDAVPGVGAGPGRSRHAENIGALGKPAAGSVGAVKFWPLELGFEQRAAAEARFVSQTRRPPSASPRCARFGYRVLSHRLVVSPRAGSPP